MNVKKIISVVVCLLLLVTTFIGCSGGKDSGNIDENTDNNEVVSDNKANSKEEKVTLTYWQHSSQARDSMMKTIAYEFMQDNPNINIKMEFIPYADYDTKLVSSLATNAAPDVMQVKSGMISKLVKADAIQSLDGNVMPAESIKKEFIPAAVEALQVDGKFYGLPTDVQTIVLYWNKALVKAEGLDAEKGPQTWDELLDWAKKLTKFENGKMIQSGWGTKGYAPEVEALVVQNGGKMVDENGQFIFADDPKSVEAIKFYVDAYKENKVYDLQFMKNWAGFRVNKVAMMLGHPAMLGNLKQTAPNVDLGIALIPAKENNNTTIVTSWAYVISKQAHSEAATKWVEYLASTEVEKRWTQETGELPARKELLTDEDLSKDPQLKLLISSIEDSKVSYLQDNATYRLFSEGYEELLLTDISVEDGLKKMQNKLNEEINRALK